MEYAIGQKMKDKNRSYTIVEHRHTNDYSVNRDSVWKVSVDGEDTTRWVSEASLNACVTIQNEHETKD